MNIFTTDEINGKTPSGIPDHSNKSPVPVGEDPNKYLQATELNTIKSKVDSNTSDVKKLMENSNEMNTITVRNLIWWQTQNGSAYNFPALQKGESRAIKIRNSDLSLAPDGTVWLGGYGGVAVGMDTLIIAMQNTSGGTFAQAGSHFLIINQKKQSVIEYYDTFDDFPVVGQVNVIYVSEQTLVTYYWSLESSEYVEIGGVVNGTLETPTLFKDSEGSYVTPDNTKIYRDTETEKTYHWNGVVYQEINPGNVGGVQFVNVMPETGNSATLYIRTSDNTLHRWDEETAAFIQLTNSKIIIDGSLHDFKKHPDNSAAELEINDLAFNVLKGRKLMPVAKLTSGTGASSADWSPVGSSINL